MNVTIFRKPIMRAATLGLCTFALGTLPMLAQDNAAPPPPQGQMGSGPGGGGRGHMEERQLEMMTKKLNLTPDQVTQVKAIDDDAMKQAMLVRNDASVEQPAKRAKMMSIHQAAQDKIRAVLTDDQKTKYDAMQAEMKARRESHEGGQGGPPPPPPPQ
jgi:protein CpxP